MFEIEGYASVFGNRDSAGEIVDRGAFAAWLLEHRGEQVPVLYQHDFNGWMPVGVTTSLQEDEIGLRYEAVILDDTVAGGTLAKLMAAGAMDGASFAYRVIDEYQEEGIWHLSAIDLREISVVLWGANPKAYAIPKGKSAPARHLRKDEPRIMQPSAAEVAAMIGDVLAA
jgi:HK97 family phage prohead protease